MKSYTKKSISKNETKKTKKLINKVLTDKEFYNLEYPYKTLYIKETDVLRNFNKLKKFKPKYYNKLNVNVKFKNRKIIFLEDYDKYKDLYSITDYFSQKCRVRCIFNIVENENVLDLFNKNKDKILKNIKQSKKPLNYYNINEEIFRNFKQCTNFNTTIVMSLLGIFKPKKWLDFSAGWGDRLIGAIAYGCEYTGVDPSECMNPIYKNIIQKLVPTKNLHKYKIIKNGFENVKIQPNNYDLVFTSPPFFDLEIYEDNNKQSVKKFKTVDSWKKNFLFPSIDKSYTSLKKGGYLALYITDFKSSTYIKDMLEYVKNNIKDMNYLGNIYWINKDVLKNKNKKLLNRKLRIVYVWQKK